MFRLAYRNFGDHESLVVNHSVTAGASIGERWYQLRPDASKNLTIYQEGTYAPDADYRWMGSIAMDQAGNMALGFSRSGTSTHPEIHFTGRLAGDALSVMTQGEGTIIDGGGSQSVSTGLTRWGDYSAMAYRPTRRLHVLVHKPVHSRRWRIQLVDSYRLVQVSRLPCAGGQRLLNLRQPGQFEPGAGHEWVEHHFDDGRRRCGDSQPCCLRCTEWCKRFTQSGVGHGW
jgi:hypothetical protein